MSGLPFFVNDLIDRKLVANNRNLYVLYSELRRRGNTPIKAWRATFDHFIKFDTDRETNKAIGLVETVCARHLPKPRLTDEQAKELAAKIERHGFKPLRPEQMSPRRKARETRTLLNQMFEFVD